jgi:hypothetical protein
MPPKASKRSRSPSASASDGGGKRSKAKPRVSEPTSPDLRTKKKIKEHSQNVKAEAEAKVQAAIAKAKSKKDARDDIIRSAKRAILVARSRNSGKETHGDVQKFADDYKIKREELRTALKQPGLKQV